MKGILIFIIIIHSLCTYSQTEESIISLKAKRDKLNIEILKLKDSINNISFKIAEIESKEFLNKINSSSFKATVRKGAQLRKEPNVFSGNIIVFDEDEEITIIDYDNGYFKVCYKSICGYINEVWFNKNQDMSDFLESKKNERLLTQKKKTSSLNYISKSKKTTNKKSSSIKSTRYKSSRTYYRGPRGGCYYINSNGNKTYVDRSLCN